MSEWDIFLQRHGATVDENNRITIRCLCDSTAIFLVDMVRTLKLIGCKEIEYDGHIVTEGIPKDKPWCNYLYTASGLLPKHLTYEDGTLRFRLDDMPALNDWRQSSLHKWLDEQIKESMSINITELFEGGRQCLTNST